MRKLNFSFYPEPVVLLNIPEFGRFFNSTVLGNFYKQLRIRVFRRGVSSLKFQSEGYVTKLAKHYDNGNLCCYITDAELAEILGDMDVRSVELKRKELIDLKLIRIERLGAGQYIYELGKRLRFQGTDGYDTGEESESFYIDSWVSRVSHGNIEDNANHPETVKFRIWITDKLAPAAKKDKILDKLRKILREAEKNFSENEAPKTTVIHAPRRQKTPAPSSPIVDKGYNTNKKDTRSVTEEKMSDTLFSESVMVDTRVEEAVAKFKSTTSREELLALSYELHKLGMDNDKIRAMITSQVATSFTRFPRLSLALTFKPASEPEKDSIVRLYAALYFDIHGKFENLGKSRKIAERLTGKYSLKQIVWTLKKILSEGKESEIEFLSGGIHTLESLLTSKNMAYGKFVRDEADRKASLEAQKVVNKEESEPQVTPVALSDEEKARVELMLNRLKKNIAPKGE